MHRPHHVHDCWLTGTAPSRVAAQTLGDVTLELMVINLAAVCTAAPR
jgi:hypothetical protein